MTTKPQRKRPSYGNVKRVFDPAYCDLILRLAEEGKWMNHFCREIRCGKQVWYRWLEEESAFQEAVDVAQPVYEAWWEEKGRDALNKPAREFNAAVWIYQMKCRFENWIEKQHVETVDKTPKATFVAPEQYNDLDEWSKAYQRGNKDGD